MTRRLTTDRRPAAAPWVLGLFVLVLLWSPAAHHDLVCHLKSPTHCTACIATPFAPGIECAAHLVRAGLPEAGRVETRPAPAAGLVAPPESAGRSPPR